MAAVTAQQQRICCFVASYRDRNGISPTYLEIGEHLGVTKQAIQYQVKLLESLGYLKKPRDARSLMVTARWKRDRRHQLDRETNPMVATLAEEQPELFAHFEETDWDALYSTRGVGGALTREGVVAAAERINQNKTMQQRAAELLENGSIREEFIDVIEDLWKRVHLSPGKGRKQRSGRSTKGETRGDLGRD